MVEWPGIGDDHEYIMKNAIVVSEGKITNILFSSTCMGSS